MGFLLPMAFGAAGLFLLLAVVAFLRAQAAVTALHRREVEYATLAARCTEIEKQAVGHAELQARAHSLETQLELARQEVESTRVRLHDWEAAQKQSVEMAQAAVMKAGSDLSTKLLEDHKREAVAARKENEERTQKITEGLVQRFEGVAQLMTNLQQQAVTNREKMDVVWRALSTPGGAGYMAEVGLENSLKNLGLEAGRDFIMQYTVKDGAGGNLRPDAVLFLPQDTVIVMDSKASKFLLEAAEAEGTAREAEIMAQLKNSMRNHLRGLTGKDYRAAVEAAYRETGRGGKIQRILSVMCLPNDAAMERLRRADAEFIQRAEEAEIIVTSPAGLYALLSIARLDIGLARQAENQEQIITTVQKLVDGVLKFVGHVEKMGKGLKSATDAFVSISGSFNRSVLPSIRVLHKMNASGLKENDLPAPMKVFYLTQPDDMLLEGDAEEKILPLHSKQLADV